MRQRNKSGRQPKSRRVVGILIDGVTSYGRQIMRGFMRYANAQRRWIIHEEMRHPSEIPPNWPECDGAIVGGLPAATFARLRGQCRHIVQCTGSPQPHDGPVVCLDDFAAGRAAAEHLLDRNLEHFGWFGWRPSPSPKPGGGSGAASTSLNRASGFIAALNERGHTCSSSELRPDAAENVDTSYRPEVVRWLVSLPKPVGIFCVDDTAARELARICLDADIAVPDRVAIVGVNNDDLLCESAWPPLSSVEADFSRVGHFAAQLLDRLFAGERIPSSERVVRLPPLGVVGRVSTDTLAVDDPELAEAIRFIRHHACDPCTVRDVLREVPVGRRWLERQFVAKLGRSPHDEIVRVRMESAQRLLVRNDFSLAEVARRSGFATIASFTRAFTQWQGTPPGTYRRGSRRPA